MLGLATAGVAAPLDPDLEPLAAECRSLLGDDEVRVVDWHDTHIDWHEFDVVVIRSTWDYTDHLDAFVSWVDHVGEVSMLLNPPEAVRWSVDKRYLTDLADDGVPVVPTTYVEHGEPAPVVDRPHVVKPTVGAGSAGASRADAAEVEARVAQLHADGRTAMVQPYVDLIDDRGETALCFVGSDRPGELRFSHAFAKAAILGGTAVEREAGLFAKETITARTPSTPELDLARRALRSARVRTSEELVFARVDIVPWRDDPSGAMTHVVLELELIEPSFYFSTARGSAADFADALAERHRRACRRRPVR